MSRVIGTIAGLAVLVAIIASALPEGTQAEGSTHTSAHQSPPATVTFYGSPAANVSAAVAIPANRASIWVSGTAPPVLKRTLPLGARERYGDTRAQAVGALKAIETQLASLGLTMRDVVFVRGYLAPDPAEGSRMDVAGWNSAFEEVFGTTANPTKPARSTLGVSALVDTRSLVEVEAFAVYPQ